MHEKKRYTYIYLPTFTFSSLLLSDCLAWGRGSESGGMSGFGPGVQDKCIPTALHLTHDDTPATCYNTQETPIKDSDQKMSRRMDTTLILH